MSDLVWRETLRAALLGTERAGADVTQVKNSAVATLVGETAFDSAESRLLTQAGLLAIHRLIGTNPVSAETPPPLTPRHEVAANATLSNLLGSMLDGRYKDVLPELLVQIQRHGLVAPAERVPNLLAYAESSLTARHLACQILSGHARQLAGLNPAWSFAATDTLDWDGAQREWKASKPAKRQAFFAPAAPLGSRLWARAAAFDLEGGGAARAAVVYPHYENQFDDGR